MGQIVVTKPTIVQKTSPNFFTGRGGHKIVAICNHIMTDTIESADNWFSSPKSGASSHFGVAKDKRIWQWVNTDNSAWTNGVVKTPDLTIPWLAEAVSKGVNPNRLTVTIEHEGKSGDIMPETQYQATLALHKWLISEFKIPVNRNHIIGHYQIDSLDRANCPGKGFPWQRLMKDLTEFFKPVLPIPPLLISQYFPETGYTVDDAQGFLTFWRAKGGLELFGYPISGVSTDTEGKQVQWFQRARFEYNATNKMVQLGLVGSEALEARQRG